MKCTLSDKKMKPFHWNFDWMRECPPPCETTLNSRFKSMKVYSDGKVVDSVGNIMGWTDPRRLDEIGSHHIYKDGEVIGSFFVSDPDSGYALAE